MKPVSSNPEKAFVGIEYLIVLMLLIFALWTLSVHITVLLEGTLSAARLLFLMMILVAGVCIHRQRHSLYGLRLSGPSSLAAGQCSGRSLPLVAVPTALSLVLIAIGQYNAFWISAVIALALGFSEAMRSNDPNPDQNSSRAEISSTAGIIVFVLAVACVAVALNLFTLRPDADDSVYLGSVRGVLDNPDIALSSVDLMLGRGEMPILIAVYKVHAYELFSAMLSDTFDADLLNVYYLAVPSLVALITVLVWALVLKQFLSAHWWLGLIFFIVFAVFLGEAHRSFGNFAFNRIFQGKTVLVIAVIPLIYYFCFKCIYSGDRSSLLPLFLAQVAAVGLTSSALYVAPIATGMAILGSIACKREISRSVFINASLASMTLIYTVALAIYFKFSGHSLDVDEGKSLNMITVIDYAHGSQQKYYVLASVLLAPVLAPTRQTRILLASVAGIFALTTLNPMLYQFFADNLTSVHTFWRIFWVLPLGLFLCSAIVGLGQIFNRYRYATVAAPALILGIFVYWSMPFNTLRYGVGPPQPKIAADYKTLQTIARETPPGTSLLADADLAAWLPLVPNHPTLIYSRPLYLRFFSDTPGTFTQESLAATHQMIRLVNRANLSEREANRLMARINQHNVGAVVFSNESPNETIATMLNSEGFRHLAIGGYNAWFRERE